MNLPLFWIKVIDALFQSLPEDEHDWTEGQTAFMISFIAMRESAFTVSVAGHRGGHKPLHGDYRNMAQTLIIWQRQAPAAARGHVRRQRHRVSGT